MSGGQQRRLSLAISLLKKPDLLFLDEITSGLDSVSSLNVCRLLRKVADERNIAVVCTIHQPSTKTFQNFDQVMVLSMGRLAYAGSRIEAENYFASMGHTIPPMTSESEHYLNTVDADFGTPEDVQNILNAWTEHTSINSKSEDSPEEKKEIEMISSEPSKLHFGTLLSRQSLLIMRDVSILYYESTQQLNMSNLWAVHFLANSVFRERTCIPCHKCNVCICLLEDS